MPVQKRSSNLIYDKTTLSVNDAMMKNMKLGQWTRQVGSGMLPGHALLKSNKRMNDIAQLAVCLKCGMN